MPELNNYSNSKVEKTRETIYRFVSWLDQFGPLSQDHYDFWASKFGQKSKAAYYEGRLWGKILVAPIVALDTVIPETRSLVRPKTRFPIADAHYAMAFFNLYKVDANERWLEQGNAFLRALLEEKCAGHPDYSWGYPFDWVTCFGTFKTGTPLITTIPYVYEAFEKGFEISGNPEYLNVMQTIASYAADKFSGDVIAPAIEACSYTPYDKRRVVNANAYRGFLLTTAAFRFHKPEWQNIGRRNLNFVINSQQADGSWLYAMDGKDAFIDNFHTCFVLKNLYKAWKYNQDPKLFASMQKGFDFYKNHLLTPFGLPIPFAKKQRISFVTQELYDFAEGINLCLLLREFDKDAQNIMEGMVEELLNNWVLADGHFCTRKLSVGKNTIPYHRWAQSQIFRSLINYYASLGK